MSFADYFVLLIDQISLLTIPLIFFVIVGFAMIRRVKLYESFIEGGKEGWEIFIMILPFIIAILVAIGLFRASGALDLLSDQISELLARIGVSRSVFPPEVLPVALMRPLSGSGSLGLVAEVIANDPDSFASRVASAMFGSTDTTFYVIALYFGSVGIKKIRHAMIVGLLADAAGVLAAVWICNLLFR